VSLLHSSPWSHTPPYGHDGGTPHAPLPLQSVSHWHELEQSMPAAQLARPVQLTVHTPGPQCTPAPHVLGELHVIAHALAWLQSTPPAHPPLPAQLTWQRRPAGHTTWVLQLLAPLQSIVHRSPAHAVHADGQPPATSIGAASGIPELASAAPGAASGLGRASGALGSASGSCAGSSAHHPSVHTRPGSQSSWVSHASASERVLNPQPVASAASASGSTVPASARIIALPT
jgi:hypothetical protein